MSSEEIKIPEEVLMAASYVYINAMYTQASEIFNNLPVTINLIKKNAYLYELENIEVWFENNDCNLDDYLVLLANGFKFLNPSRK